MGGTHYKVGAFVVVDSSLLPEFACIVDIVVTEGFDCVFVCEKYTSLCFNAHFHSYEVIKCSPSLICAVMQGDLIDFHTYSTHSISNVSFIRLKYHVTEKI